MGSLFKQNLSWDPKRLGQAVQGIEGWILSGLRLELGHVDAVKSCPHGQLVLGEPPLRSKTADCLAEFS